jgi:hypothetical protein
MNVYQVIIAAINAYLEREKARQDEQRTMEIIRAINATVLENRQIIEDALRDWEIDRLKYGPGLHQKCDFEGKNIACCYGDYSLTVVLLSAGT